jgi:hypothetical protein
MTFSMRSIIGSGVFCGRCFGRCCDGEKGGVCGRVRSAGVRAPGGTLSSGGVSGVTSCAGLESIDQYCTTYVHACTNDASKCAAGMCWRTMPDCDAYERGAGSALPQYRNSHASFPRICVVSLPLSHRPSRNAQEDLMGVRIVHGRSMVKVYLYSMT